LIIDLKKISDKVEFSEHFLSYLTDQLEKGKSRFDPREMRDIYIKKVYSNMDLGRSYTINNRGTNRALIGNNKNLIQGNALYPSFMNYNDTTISNFGYD
jgi:hypothetical protein